MNCAVFLAGSLTTLCLVKFKEFYSQFYGSVLVILTSIVTSLRFVLVNRAVGVKEHLHPG